MNVHIICSSRDKIDNSYKDVARRVSHFLATNNCDLVYGGGSQSMMGICYEEFSKMNRKIYAYTNAKYKDELVDLPKATHNLCETTFDLKKEMFQKCDLVLCLPGGLGTISELLSYIEEKRSNDKEVPIIIYDEDGYYSEILKFMEVMVDKKFNDENVYLNYAIAKNKEELETLFNKVRYNEKGRIK